MYIDKDSQLIYEATKKIRSVPIALLKSRGYKHPFIAIWDKFTREGKPYPAHRKLRLWTDDDEKTFFDIYQWTKSHSPNDIIFTFKDFVVEIVYDGPYGGYMESLKNK